jgi:hypothetical protein
MQSVEEFMQGFFCARKAQVERELASFKPFRETFFTPTCCWGNRKEEKNLYESESVENVSLSGDDAIAVTRLAFIMPRFRYHLQKSKDSWLISCVEGECPSCHGNSGNNSCGCCRGTGWLDTNTKNGDAEKE